LSGKIAQEYTPEIKPATTAPAAKYLQKLSHIAVGTGWDLQRVAVAKALRQLLPRKNVRVALWRQCEAGEETYIQRICVLHLIAMPIGNETAGGEVCI
jgi:hypothetical protein